MLLTAVFGTGIGLTQPALPRLARGLLPSRLGLATGVYAGGFFAGSFLAAFLTAPVLLPLTDSRSWRLPLAIWGGLALVGLGVWIAALPGWRLREEPSLPPGQGSAAAGVAGWSPWRDRAAWRVALLFAGQGVAYYLLVAWLPSIYEGAGVEETTGGALFALFNVAAFPAMVGLPPLSDRLGSRRAASVLAGCLFLAGAFGLALAPHADGWRWLWPLLTGFGVGGLFAMGLVLPVDVAPRHAIGATAGMILGVGYLGSALGPIVGGAARDVTGSFDAALALLPILGVALVALALTVPRRISPTALAEPAEPAPGPGPAPRSRPAGGR
jgi:CP family cyanate transporter-like MFS transporter